MKKMSSKEFKELAPYDQKASRIELIIRWLYGIIINIIFWIWGIFIGIINFIHFWYILILGRRSLTIYKHTRRYITALAYVESYLMFLTDSRPDLTPNLLFSYREAEESEASGESSESKSCTSCEAKIPHKSEFCPKCGTKQ